MSTSPPLQYLNFKQLIDLTGAVQRLIRSRLWAQIVVGMILGVTLGMLEGRRIRVAAVSHSPQFDKRANLMRAIERAMEEAVDQEEMVVFPAEREGRPVVARAHEALLHESEAGSAATFPLVHGERVVGALTFERAAGHRFEVPALEICAAVASVAGPIIELKHGNEASLPRHAGRSAKGLWDKLVGPGHPGWKLGAIGISALAAFLALATGAFRVSAKVVRLSRPAVLQRSVQATTVIPHMYPISDVEAVTVNR